jgi:ATPase subunit of ABC transporter with duplicated ATPase domains
VPLLSCSDVAVEFGATTLLRDVSFTVAAGERWGIVGRNGAGKTTLLRLIDGSLAPARGTVTREPGLRIALLDQNRAFGGAASVWDAAASGYGSLLELEHDLARHIQNHLGAFGFSGDEVQRSTRVLSGGERARGAGATRAAAGEPPRARRAHQ